MGDVAKRDLHWRPQLFPALWQRVSVVLVRSNPIDDNHWPDVASPSTNRSRTERSAIPGGKACDGTLTRSHNLTYWQKDGVTAGMTITCGHAVPLMWQNLMELASVRGLVRAVVLGQARPDHTCLWPSYLHRVAAASWLLAGGKACGSWLVELDLAP